MPSFLRDHPRDIVRSITEVFWNNDLSPDQALAINTAIQNLPDRWLTDAEKASAISSFISMGLDQGEAQDAVDQHNAEYPNPNGMGGSPALGGTYRATAPSMSTSNYPGPMGPPPLKP